MPIQAADNQEDTDDILFGSGEGGVFDGGGGDDQIFPDGPAAIIFGEELANTIYRLYQTALDRAPDKQGHFNWTKKLAEGTHDLRQISEGFLYSEEFGKFEMLFPEGLSGFDYVRTLQQNAFSVQRAINISEVPVPVRELMTIEARDTRAEILAFYAQAPRAITAHTPNASEFAYASASDANGWADDVFRAYKAAFDRAPTLEELIAGVDQLEATVGVRKMRKFVEDLVPSPEFFTVYGNDLSHFTNPGFITDVYRTVLDRAPDAAGAGRWSYEHRFGGPETVIFGFTQSDELKIKTAGALKAWMRDHEEQSNSIAAGPGENLVAGGMFADTFIFEAGAATRTTIVEFEPWDWIDLNGFGYTNTAQAKAQMTQDGADVVFKDQEVEIVFDNTTLDAITNDMILI